MTTNTALKGIDSGKHYHQGIINPNELSNQSWGRSPATSFYGAGPSDTFHNDPAKHRRSRSEHSIKLLKKRWKTIERTLYSLSHLRCLPPFFERIYSFINNKLNKRTASIASLSGRKPKFLKAEAENKLKAITGPTRLLANAVIATQLDHLDGINKPPVISDHLPISFLARQSDNSPPVQITSWNLLAEIHLINNFRSIKLDSLILSLYDSGKLQYFKYNNNVSPQRLLSDLAAELTSSGLFNTTEIRNEFYLGSEKGIKTFLNFLQDYYVNGNNAVLLHARERSDKEQLTTLRSEGRSALKDAVMELSKNNSDFSSTEFYEIAVHAVKLYYTLKTGSMSWEKRKNCLKNNKKLLDKISRSEVILLQECTDPFWFLSQLNQLKDNPEYDGFNAIVYKVGNSEKNNDHCVIIYDRSKWQINTPNMDITAFKLGVNRPGLLVRLTPKQPDASLSTAKPVVIGSLHYPFDKDGKNHLTKIGEQLKILRFKEEDNIIVAGDFNQSKQELSEKIDHLHRTRANQGVIDYSSLNVCEPESSGGSMVSSDFERILEGRKVDLAFSNMYVTGAVFDPSLLV